MFLLGVLVGAGLALGALWLRRHRGAQSLTVEATARQARQQIQDLERTAILRMLTEAEAQRRYGEAEL